MENIEKLFEKDAFKNLEPERKTAFINLMEKIQGKNQTEVMAVLLDFSKNMPKGNPLSQEEKNLMMQAMLETMPESERAKAQSILRMMEVMSMRK